MSSAVARGLQFNYSTLGSGAPPIMAIHGLVLDNMSSFFFTIGPELAKRSRLLIYDLRGHGRSDQPSDGYTIDELARDAEALLDATHFSDEPVVVIGHSFGGLIALRMAMMFPERVRGLVLIEGLTGTPEFGARLAATLTAPEDEQVETIRELFGNWVTLQEAKGRREDVVSTINRVDDMQSRQRRHPIEKVQALVRETSLVRDMAETVPLSPADLAGITCPVLAIYGADSDVLPEGKRLAESLPNCRLELVPNSGHKVMWLESQTTVPVINAWLDQWR